MEYEGPWDGGMYLNEIGSMHFWLTGSVKAVIQDSARLATEIQDCDIHSQPVLFYSHVSLKSNYAQDVLKKVTGVQTNIWQSEAAAVYVEINWHEATGQL